MCLCVKTSGNRQCKELVSLYLAYPPECMCICICALRLVQCERELAGLLCSVLCTREDESSGLDSQLRQVGIFLWYSWMQLLDSCAVKWRQKVREQAKPGILKRKENMCRTAACCFHSGWPVKGRVRQVGFGAKISAFSHANKEKKTFNQETHYKNRIS